MINKNSVDIKLELLQAVHTFYPLGLPWMAESHQGHQNLKALVVTKINNAIENNPASWFSLAENLKTLFKEFQTFNFAGHPFPSYEFTILLRDEIRHGSNVAISMTVNLSLLVNYYTAYVYEHFSFESSGHGIVHRTEQYDEALSSKLQSLKKELAHLFPGYLYVDPQHVFRHKILGGFGYGGDETDMNNHTFFDFLFSNTLVNRRYTFAH